MLSLHIWRALTRPPSHSPLLRRMRAEKLELPSLRSLPLAGCLRSLALTIIPILILLIGSPVLVLLIYMSLLSTPILLPLAHTLYGVTAATSISGMIAREYDLRTYDVISVSPPGALGVHWAYCMVWISQHRYYRDIIGFLLVLGILAALFGLTTRTFFTAVPEFGAVWVVQSLALIAFLCVDFVQSFATTALVGILIPVHVQQAGNARLLAFGSALSLHLAAYLLALIVATQFLPLLAVVTGGSQIVSAISPVLLVLTFAAFREFIVHLLWRAVEQNLNASPMELDQIVGKRV